jgi:hypothetical protein
MLSSLSRLRKGRHTHRSDRSPFSSPFSGLLSSPIAARRGSMEERRRPAADFDRDASSARHIKIDEEPEEEEGDQEEDVEEEIEEEVEDVNEDDEDSPLLPIFSAAHLGIL